ncbi:MAG: SDR family oxidoreductase [Cyanobacteria bacterium SBLK]|nr:SDR family oxidoreductase [Cyanobacteria bacterium SBLK]
MAGKTIVLAGVTKGLGRAMTEEFNNLGHIVLGCGRSRGEIETLQEIYPEGDFQVVDIADADRVEGWRDRLLEKWDAPDYLINNAALINSPAPLWEIGDREFSQLIDVNIKGTANTIRAFLPSMIAKKAGVVVNFSSGWGRSTSPEVVPYCASKWAIEGLSRGLAREVPKNIAVVALNPGIIDTEMLRTCWGEGAAGYPQPQQWAKKAVPFILKIKSRDNGKSLTVS